MRIPKHVALIAILLSTAGLGLTQAAAYAVDKSFEAVRAEMKNTAAETGAQTERGSVETLIEEAKADYARQKQFILAAADAMPETGYGFKATPDVRTFGELIMHVAQTQDAACAIIAGQAPGQPSAPATSKAAIVARLKSSFDRCDAANATVNPSNAFDILGKGFLHGTRVGIIEKNLAHDNEMYGTMSVYLRLKGIVPPSSAHRGRK